eukprot:1157437-Pelagomonas_calceolata.AAC.4
MCGQRDWLPFAHPRKLPQLGLFPLVIPSTQLPGPRQAILDSSKGWVARDSVYMLPFIDIRAKEAIL